MLVVTIVFILLSGFWGMLYCLQRIHTKRLTKQLQKLNNEKRNQLVTMSLPSKTNEAFVQEINHLLLEKQRTEQMWRVEEIRMQEMISNISHDMRTPLTAILGYIHLINSDEISEEERKKYLTIIETRAKALQRLILDFYDISRLDEGSYQMQMQSMDVNRYCLEMLAELYDTFEQEGISIEVDLLLDAPKVLADYEAVQRIYENLFQNAKKHGGNKIIVSSRLIEHALLVSISNDSPYISNEQLTRIFERSYTTNKSRTMGNTGLGLAICKALIEQMGHEINATYQNGMFTILIKYHLL